MSAQQTEHSELRRYLQTERFGTPHKYIDAISSTNDAAREWAATGAEEGAMVWAEQQRSGRGRFGKPWTSQHGKNLTFSIILRPQLKGNLISLLPLLAGLGVARALDAHLSTAATLKWPNDVLIRSAKCAGILCESYSSSRGTTTIIAGIGVNVNQVSFSEDYNRTPTSVALEAGRPVNRVLLLANILRELETLYEHAWPDHAALIQQYEKRMAYLNEPVLFRRQPTDEPVRGTCRGISEAGGLLLESDGHVQTLFAGDVSTHMT